MSLDLSLSRLGAIVGLALAVLPGDALAAALAAGVALGTSNRPRRCDAVGATEADAEETGLDVAEEVGVCCEAAARCGVIRGVAVAAAVCAVCGSSFGKRKRNTREEYSSRHLP